MTPGAPSLYLDPLLPLQLRSNARTVQTVAGAMPAIAAIIVISGGVRVGEVRVPAPGLLWRPSNESVAIRPTRTGGPTSGEEAQWWLLVVGQRLLDQLIVSAFGEPGFSRFLEGFTSPGSTPSGELDNELTGLLGSLTRELDKRPPAFRVRARSLLTDVMLALYRSTLTAEIAPEAGGFRVGAVIDHIELNYDDHLDLESLAALMETSPTHLSRVFRREVGIPLFEYINRTRIRKACALLRRTDYPVTRIAIDVGYNNVSFFNRYFRRIMRCSPREYRRSVEE